MNGIIADQSKIGVKSLDNATSFVEGRFNGIRQEQMKLDSKAIQSITAGVATGSVMSEKAYESEKENTMSTSEYNGLIVGFSIIIMIVSSLAASYIISSVNEEKQSKLAESLLVSVRPMALLLGKVLGMLTFVAGTIILGVIGSSIVNYVMENVMKLDMSTLNKAGLNLAIFTSYGAKGLVVFLVEILVGLCSFGVLSGILGSACGKTEDQQNATTLITTITMIGYFATIFLGMKPEYALIGTLVPPVSYFMAPVAYIVGAVAPDYRPLIYCLFEFLTAFLFIFNIPWPKPHGKQFLIMIVIGVALFAGVLLL
jgi:ABC-type Na+ efflux pump permease subunit